MDVEETVHISTDLHRLPRFNGSFENLADWFEYHVEGAMEHFADATNGFDPRTRSQCERDVRDVFIETLGREPHLPQYT